MIALAYYLLVLPAHLKSMGYVKHKKPPWTELYGTDVKNEEITYQKVHHDTRTIIIIIMIMSVCFKMHVYVVQDFFPLAHKKVTNIGSIKIYYALQS